LAAFRAFDLGDDDPASLASVSWRIAGRARIKVSLSLRPDRTNPQHT
jgi:hypothetical protein